MIWFPALIALYYLWPLLSLRVQSLPLLAVGVFYALLAGLSEETTFRGVILQALLPFGPRAAAALSALIFGLYHLGNILFRSPALVIPQAVGALLLGFGFAAVRLRINTLWPLIIIHMLYDLAVDIALFASRRAATGGNVPISPVALAIGLIGPGLLVAAYGLFLLRPRRQPAVQSMT